MNLTSIFINVVHKLGLDKSIAYSSGARVIQGITGLTSVFFITSFLTGIEQGFYFTFGSLLSMQVFFELGLTSIMTQYVAHEVSHLELNEDGIYMGDGKYRSRLASLIQFCVKWYAVISAIVFVFLMIVGFVFFNSYGNKQDHVDWQIPWILICLGTSIKLFQSPFTSILTGLGMVKEMSKASFYQQIIMPVSIWIGLTCGFKLYVMGVGYILSEIYLNLFIYKHGLFKILKKLWSENITEKVEYFKEIFPFQWRIALSWISGYFVFQLFNPVLFAKEGAIVAGQMGMTLQALGAIQGFAFSWINTKVPLFSKLIALKDYLTLDKIFNKTLKQMTRICLVFLLMFLLAIFILNISQFKFNNNVLANRFLGYTPLLLMMFPVYFQQYINSWATYLRCHKKEPFLIYSICFGILSVTSVLLLGKYLGLYGLTIGYCTLTMLFFPWGYYIFKSKKTEWHR